LNANTCERSIVFCNTIEQCRKVENILHREVSELYCRRPTYTCTQCVYAMMWAGPQQLGARCVRLPRSGGRGFPREERGGVLPAAAAPARHTRVHRPGFKGHGLQQGQGKETERKGLYSR
jgi:hypothetical protein